MIHAANYCDGRVAAGADALLAHRKRVESRDQRLSRAAGRDE